MSEVTFALGNGSSERPEELLAEGASKSSGSGKREFAIGAGNAIQALFCLIDLIRTKADDAGEVNDYSNLAAQKLKELSELMRPMLYAATRDSAIGLP